MQTPTSEICWTSLAVSSVRASALSAGNSPNNNLAAPSQVDWAEMCASAVTKGFWSVQRANSLPSSGPAFGNGEEDKVAAQGDQHGKLLRRAFRSLAADAREQPRGQADLAFGNGVLFEVFHRQLLGDLLAIGDRQRGHEFRHGLGVLRFEDDENRAPFIADAFTDAHLLLDQLQERDALLDVEL